MIFFNSHRKKSVFIFLVTLILFTPINVQANSLFSPDKTIQGLNNSEKQNLFSLYNDYGLVYDSQNNILLFNDIKVRYFYDEFNKCGFINYADGYADLKIIRDSENQIVSIDLINGDEYFKKTSEINQSLNSRIESIKNIFNTENVDLSYPFVQFSNDEFKSYTKLDTENDIVIENTKTEMYVVLYDDNKLQPFARLDDALDFYKQVNGIIIFEDLKDKAIWYKTPDYIYSNDNFISVSNSLEFLINENKEIPNSTIYNNNSIIWTNNVEYKDSILLEVPCIRQLPELSKGCEVTSAAMMLNYAGYDVDKITLAHEIDKDDTNYYVKNGIAYYGDPSKGFIGDMFTNKRGYGADHVPIYKLLKNYIDTTIDITNSDFDSIYYYLNINSPVWVITNTDLKKLNENEFYTWQTPENKTIRATNKEHAVLIVGYDQDYIYINDPLYSEVKRKVKKQDFIEAWEQMGRQAVTYIK